jgi:RNA polymerase primary sigma factor
VRKPDPRDELDPLTLLVRDADEPLLTAEQEVALSHRLHGMDVPVPPPGPARPTPLEARNRLITANIRLIIRLAKRYESQGVEVADLVQEGSIGLEHAVRKFKPEKGFRLSTYVTWWIRQHVGRSVYNQKHMTRVPVHVGGKVRRMLTAESELISGEGRMPTIEEIAEQSGIPVEELRAILRITATPASLDAPIRWKIGDEDATVADFVADEEDGHARVVEEDTQAGVRYALSFLPDPRERIIIALRWGMGQDKEFSLQEAGQVVGVTRERARQLETAGMTRIRQDKMLLSMFRSMLDRA